MAYFCLWLIWESRDDFKTEKETQWHVASFFWLRNNHVRYHHINMLPFCAHVNKPSHIHKTVLLCRLIKAFLEIFKHFYCWLEELPKRFKIDHAVKKVRVFGTFLVGGGDIRYWLEMTSFWFAMVSRVMSNIGGWGGHFVSAKKINRACRVAVDAVGMQWMQWTQ